MKFFPNDWLADECLRCCSFAARGLWIDLLCLMHKCVRRGYLQQENGTSLPLSKIARMAGADQAEVAHLLQELVDSGVVSVSPEGIYFSRRMVREERISEVRSKAGRKGGKTTGVLLKQTVKQNPSKGASKVWPLASGSLNGVGDCGEGESKPFELSPAGLAQAWTFYGGKISASVRSDEFAACRDFAELIRIGHKPADLLGLIVDNQKQRDRTEYLWQFKKRLEEDRVPKSGGSLGQTSRVSVTDQQRDAIAAKTKRVG